MLLDGAGGALTVTVLPKPWGPTKGRHLLIPEHIPGATSHVTMFETDSAEVQSHPATIASLTQSVLTISGEDGQQDLLELRRASGGGIATAATTTGDAFNSVVSLMLLAKRQRASLGDGYRGMAAQSLMRLIEQQLFVEQVSRVIDRARPAYIERVEHLSSPRGTLSGTSLALALLTGIPEIRCRFDEQSTDTTVLQIILAGLRAVATDRVPASLVRLASSTQSQAVALARRLDSVTVLDAERALLAARRLVLNSLERPWANALRGAVQVLSQRSVVPLAGEVETDRSIAIHLYMEKWWEQCLLGALRAITSPDDVYEQVPVEAPWQPMDSNVESEPRRRADFVFALDDHYVLADAKYKVDGMTLGTSDADQMFAYSHMAIAPGTSQLTHEGVVFFPRRCDGRRLRATGTRQVLVRATEPRYELRLLDLPFPSPEEVVSDAAWSGYQATLGDVIGQELSTPKDNGATPAA